jgi:hypothetical protein
MTHKKLISVDDETHFTIKRIVLEMKARGENKTSEREINSEALKIGVGIIADREIPKGRR